MKRRPPFGDPGLLQIRVTEFAERLTKALNLSGSAPNVLDPTVQVGIQLADMDNVEYAWLRRTSRFHAGIAVGAVAAQNGGMSLSLITNQAPTMAVIEELQFTNYAATTSLFYMDLAAAALVGGSVRVQPLDGRMTGGVARPQVALNGGTAAISIPATAVSITVPANATVTIQPNLVLTSTGSATQTLNLFCATANQSASFYARWRERLMAGPESS